MEKNYSPDYVKNTITSLKKGSLGQHFNDMALSLRSLNRNNPDGVKISCEIIVDTPNYENASEIFSEVFKLCTVFKRCFKGSYSVNWKVDRAGLESMIVNLVVGDEKDTDQLEISVSVEEEKILVEEGKKQS